MNWLYVVLIQLWYKGAQACIATIYQQSLYSILGTLLISKGFICPRIPEIVVSALLSSNFPVLVLDYETDILHTLFYSTVKITLWASTVSPPHPRSLDEVTGAEVTVTSPRFVWCSLVLWATVLMAPDLWSALFGEACWQWAPVQHEASGRLWQTCQTWGVTSKWTCT